MAGEANADIEFWEFVSCAKCHLPYASESGKSIPFWLTECGHVICNHHLNPDQTCASCGANGILLVPLQQELDAPMSDWFRSLPSALDAVAFAAKFQQEVMARQIRFYRSRHQQIRTVIEKLRSEISELKKTNEVLTQENEQLKEQFGRQDYGSQVGQEPLTTINQNGKRMISHSTHQSDPPSIRPRTGSSPLRGPMVAARLTLPARQHYPELSQRKEAVQHVVQMPSEVSPHHTTHRTDVRPMSRQIGKFAYIPPETSQGLVPTLSHEQTAPRLIRPSQLNQSKQNETFRIKNQNTQPRNMMPYHDSEQQNRGGNMGPPPVPQARLATPIPSSGFDQSGTSSRRFVPPQSTPRQQSQPSASHGPQRFLPRVGANSSGASASWSNSFNSRRPSGAGYG